MKQTITFHHRQALSPRLQADDIERLLPLVSTGLKPRRDRKSFGTAVSPNTAANEPCTPRECVHIVEDFSKALHTVKCERLQRLVTDSATHYESASELASSAKRKKRPSSAAIYKSLGEEFGIDQLTASVPGNKLHETLLGTESSPRPTSAVKKSSRPTTAGRRSQSNTPRTSTSGPSDPHGIPPQHLKLNIPQPPPRPTTAPAARRKSSKAADLEDDGIAVDDDDGDHAAETMGGPAAKPPRRKPQSAQMPKRSPSTPMQLASTATMGTARIIPVVENKPKEPFFTNFNYTSIRQYLSERKRAEFGSYRDNVMQHIEDQLETQRAQEHSGAPRLPTPREYVEQLAHAEEQRELAAQANKQTAIAREAQDKSVERLSKNKVSAVIVSSRKLNSTLKRRPASAKSSRK